MLPAAGLGTRFLPATKAQPKEMLPVVDKPLIQYSVEECVDSGIENVIIVTGRGKNAIEDHFDASPELEAFLERKGRQDQAEPVRQIGNLVRFSYTRQKEPRGLGHTQRGRLRHARHLQTHRVTAGQEPRQIVGQPLLPRLRRRLLQAAHQVATGAVATDGPAQDQAN